MSSQSSLSHKRKQPPSFSCANQTKKSISSIRASKRRSLHESCFAVSSFPTAKKSLNNYISRRRKMLMKKRVEKECKTKRMAKKSVYPPHNTCLANQSTIFDKDRVKDIKSTLENDHNVYNWDERITQKRNEVDNDNKTEHVPDLQDCKNGTNLIIYETDGSKFNLISEFEDRMLYSVPTFQKEFASIISEDSQEKIERSPSGKDSKKHTICTGNNANEKQERQKKISNALKEALLEDGKREYQDLEGWRNYETEERSSQNPSYCEEIENNVGEGRQDSVGNVKEILYPVSMSSLNEDTNNPCTSQVSCNEKSEIKCNLYNFESRGLNGWEQSLRQQPKSVVKFQATFQPDSLDNKAGESKVKKKTTSKQELKDASKASTQQETQLDQLDKFLIGELVWGKIKGFPYWPGQVVYHNSGNPTEASIGSRWVKWFGDGKYSQVKFDDLSSIVQFNEFYQATYSKRFSLYKSAVFQVLKVCAKRAKMDFPSEFNERPLTKQQSIIEEETLKIALINWALEGFLPLGIHGLAPPQEEQKPINMIVNQETSPLKNAAKDVSREERIEEAKAGRINIKDMCIGCGSLDVTCSHPLFVGGLCEICRVEFLETSYLFDNDGYQSFCCVCCEGNEVLLCGNSSCYRSFCFDCVKLLDSNMALKEAIKQDNWSCYMCRPNMKTRMMTRRDDWPEQLVKIFKNDCVQNFEPFRSFVAPALKDRHPIRVLGLFDGIGTGMVALKELGFEVECYFASEVNEDAINVVKVRHSEAIVQVGDVKNITRKQIEEWGPFDLVMGGNPCNDLSIVNPARKGLFGGTGRLFFEFWRILSYAKPPEGDTRPFFWFLENVCFMEHGDKMAISRFLECNPVVVDAKNLSPAHRARYFWGNLPGMDRPYIATDNHSLSLQDCLEPNCNRQAQFNKIRTITTKSNSVKQSKEKVLPVVMNGKEDGLWCTEMERLFGFPEHYTDVSNMGRVARQRLLGRAWSVPVVKHLLAPLKDFFACRTL